jgi:hypothetical protein
MQQSVTITILLKPCRSTTEVTRRKLAAHATGWIAAAAIQAIRPTPFCL